MSKDTLLSDIVLVTARARNAFGWNRVKNSR